MEGEVIKEIEKTKTDGFIEDKKLDKRKSWDKIRKKLDKLEPGETITIPGGEYDLGRTKEESGRVGN